MSGRKLEKMINTAFNHVTPDFSDSIVTACKEQKGELILMTGNKNNFSFAKIIVATAAALILVVGGVIGYNYQKQDNIDSIVFLDVNPSIELSVNKNDRVVGVAALNGEAEKVLNDMDFKNTDLDVAVNAIIGSMLKNGYLSEISNSILVSVENDDIQRSQALQEHISKIVNDMLGTEGGGAVIGQTVERNTEIKELAEKYGISDGKAALILEVSKKKGNTLTLDQLNELNMNQLNLILKSKNIELDGKTDIGTPSEKSYIGSDAAKKAAFTHAGVKEADVTNLFVSMDWDDGIMVYDVEFNVGNIECEYEINALNGDVIEHNKEKDDDYVTTQRKDNLNKEDTNANYIGLEKAKSIAKSHAGVGTVTFTKAKLDKDDGIVVYELEFRTSTKEYDYEINAKTGKVIAYDVENRDDDDGDDYIRPSGNTNNTNSINNTKNTNSINNTKNINNTNNTKNTNNYIGLEKAKSIAKSHAGVGAVTFTKAKLGRDDGIVVYELEFRTSTKEYDYEINAETGAVIDYDAERIEFDDDYDDD